MIYMLVYIPMVIPGTWLLNRCGLRVSLLTGASLNAFGACIKCVALELSQPYGVDTPSAMASFPILMAAQCICALAQVFTLGMPAQLAATWFGESELALATSIGVFANQVGCAFGFGFPPLMVPDPSNTNSFEDFRHGFRILLYGGAAIMLISFIIVAIFFKEEPKAPPSRAQFKRIMQREGIVPNDAEGELKALPASDVDSSILNSEVTYAMKKNFFLQITHCLKNINFVFLTICYGVNTGVYYEIGTLLNPVISEFFPKEQVAIGWVGFSMIITGMVGSLVAGVILKRTGQYRRVFLIFYMLSVVSWVAFMGSLYSPHISIIFLTMILLGFFQSGFLPLGFEYAAEITYPIEEGLTSGILNTSAQIFGIALTYSATALLDRYKALIANIFILICLIAAAIPACKLNIKEPIELNEN
ncbi:hypothetical protein Aperf_G00000027829 [Anoplocephala perfoliata]